jgi:peptidoglycan/xylan/chitin deacetylase (PgdA/CDA1 family)
MDAILAFHSIDDSGSVLSYRKDELARLVDGLRDEEVELVRLDELAAPPASGRHRVALTFDDGMRSVHRDALPVLAAAKAPFTVYLVSGFIGRDNRWPSQPPSIPRFELMDWAELEELAAAGVELGGHTASHAALRGLGETELRRELADSKRELEQRLGRPVRHFAYPYGAFDEAAARAVAASYASSVTTKLAFLADPGRERPRATLHGLPRLDSYYLREPARRLPLFGAASRRRLAFRALLRRVKSSALRAGGAGYGG